VPLVPVMEIELSCIVAVPVLLKLRVWGALVVFRVWLPNVTDTGLIVATGAMPAPESPTVGNGLSPSVDRLKDPEMLLAAKGAKETLIEQLAFGARDAPHEFVWLNPVLAVTSEILNAMLPVLVRVTACGALVVPTS